MHLLVLL